MNIFVIVTTVVLIIVGLLGIYYQRKQASKKGKITQRSTSAIKADGISNSIIKGNKSYGLDHVVDITNSDNNEISDNEAHK
jgi:uncharacterized protein (UPF0333 family)